MSGRRAGEYEWTPERVARARAMWLAGDTTAAIGRAFGITKNTIVGIARRKGFPKRPSPIYVGPPKSKIKAEPRAPRVAKERAVRKPPLPRQATGSRGTGAVKGRTLPSGDLANINRTTPVERQHVAGTAARMPLTGATLPGLQIDPKPSMPVVAHTGRISKCAWLYGERGNYRSCDIPTVPGRSWCPEHAGVCLVARDVGREHDNEHTAAA